jgi:hypothetical protein
LEVWLGCGLPHLPEQLSRLHVSKTYLSQGGIISPGMAKLNSTTEGKMKSKTTIETVSSRFSEDELNAICELIQISNCALPWKDKKKLLEAGLERHWLALVGESE